MIATIKVEAMVQKDSYEKNRYEVLIFAGVSLSSNSAVKDKVKEMDIDGVRSLVFSLNPNFGNTHYEGNVVEASAVRNQDFYSYRVIDCSEVMVPKWNHRLINKWCKRIELVFTGRKYWKLINKLLKEFPPDFEPSLMLYSDHDSLTPVWQLSKVWRRAAVGKVG